MDELGDEQTRGWSGDEQTNKMRIPLRSIQTDFAPRAATQRDRRVQCASRQIGGCVGRSGERRGGEGL